MTNTTTKKKPTVRSRIVVATAVLVALLALLGALNKDLDALDTTVTLLTTVVGHLHQLVSTATAPW